MITIHDGNYHYSEDIGIHDINLHIEKGANGGFDGTEWSRKSTLFKILVGLLRSLLDNIILTIGRWMQTLKDPSTPAIYTNRSV